MAMAKDRNYLGAGALRQVSTLLIALAFAFGLALTPASAVGSSSPSADTVVQLFSPRSAEWIGVPFSQVKPLSEFTWDGRLYRMTASGAEVVPSIDVTKLADADRVYDKSSRVPHADDVVMVLDGGLKYVRHALLSSVDAGTKVSFEGKVYDLAAGRVLTDTGIVSSRVAKAFKRQTDSLVDLRVRSADGRETVVTGTPEHPFYVPSTGRYVGMGRLASGTALKTADGSAVTVVGGASRQGSFDVYNFEVEGEHSYFVADQGLLVHNACGYDLVLGTRAKGVLETTLADVSREYALAGGPRSGLGLPQLAPISILDEPKAFANLLEGAKRIHFNPRLLSDSTPITAAEMEYILQHRELWDKVWIYF